MAAKVQTASWHIEGKFHVIIDRVVHSFDAIRVVDGKFWIEWCLNDLVDDAIANAKSIENEFSAAGIAGVDLLVLFVEVIEESRTCQFLQQQLEQLDDLLLP